MRTINLFGKFAMLVAIASFGFLTSCKDDETVNLQDITDASSESLSESYFQDADDISIYAIDNKSNAGASRSAGDDDYRITCAEISKTGGSTSGTVVIDFGTGVGCTDGKGNVRKGKINLAYEGTLGAVNFTITETFDNYSINGIVLEGTRVIKRIEASSQANVKHSIKLTGGKATWPDASFAVRASSFEREWNPTDGTITLTGDAEGTSRSGKTYSMDITSALIYKTSCIAEGIYMATTGIKVFTIDGKPITINFGDGTCDRKIAITVNGITKEVTVSKI